MNIEDSSEKLTVTDETFEAAIATALRQCTGFKPDRVTCVEEDSNCYLIEYYHNPAGQSVTSESFGLPNPQHLAHRLVSEYANVTVTNINHHRAYWRQLKPIIAIAIYIRIAST